MGAYVQGKKNKQTINDLYRKKVEQPGIQGAIIEWGACLSISVTPQASLHRMYLAEMTFSQSGCANGSYD